MTYEQGSARGLVMRRADGSRLHFRETVRQQFVASLATAQTAAVNREKLLRDFYEYRASAVEEGRRGKIRSYLIPRRGDVSSVDKLAALLTRQGIEVKQALEPIRVSGTDFPEGTFK